jgi:hypothetical protein
MGSGSVRIADESPLSIVGGASIQKPALHTPYPPQTGAIPMAYPPAIQMPKVGCGNQMATIIGEDGSRMTPGNWEEDFPPDGVTHLESGVYCINGDFIVGDGEVLIGDGVILKVENGVVKLSSRSKVKLTAPDNGSNAGLLLYMPLNNNKRLSLNGGSESSFKGPIFAPGAEIHLNGLESPRGFHSQIIGYTIEVDGTDVIYITYADDDNYDAYRMPEVLLSQ